MEPAWTCLLNKMFGDKELTGKLDEFYKKTESLKMEATKFCQLLSDVMEI